MADQDDDRRLLEIPEVATVPRQALDLRPLTHLCEETMEPSIEMHEMPTAEPVRHPEPILIDSPAGENQGQEVDESEFDETLETGDLNEIKKSLTQFAFKKFGTNSLEKSLEVSYILNSFAEKSTGPDKEDFVSLSNSVEEYAVKLLDPLKSDELKRAIFEEEGFERISEKLVSFGQKKVISHPMIYSLLMRQWTGAFSHLGNSKWKYIKWILLNIWAFFDVLLFPFVFAFLFLVCKIAVFVTKRQDHAVMLVLNAMSENMETNLDNMRELAGEVIDKFDIDQTKCKYAPWILNLHGIAQNNFLGREEAKKAIHSSSFERQSNKLALHGRFKYGKVSRALASSPVCDRNKTIVLMTDFVIGYHMCQSHIDEVKRNGCRVICVGFVASEFLSMAELCRIATDDHVVIYGEARKEDVLQKVHKGIHGYSLFDKYLRYFNTPYFIFVRDTLSYLALLGLHFAVCLQPSTLHFTALEWVIMLFFIGRCLIEVDQAVVEMQMYARPNRTICSVFISNMSKYLSDWWNALDVATLLLYIIILILRSITWTDQITVSNNRLLAVAGYFYGLNTMLLTLRVFGNIMESTKKTGSIQIALFQIIGAIVAVLGQFLASTLAFSLAITKVYVVEMSYTAGNNSTSHGFCENRSGGMACWLSSATHLLWSLLGIADLGPLQSSDGPSDVLAKILYGIFLVLAVVMLMNMMIALLSNTYQQVQDNAIYEWSYRKATTIRTYSNYHPVPVPFNIISLVFIFIRYLYTIVKQNGRSESTASKGLNSSCSEMFDNLVNDLQTEYCATHGCEFPMADSDKMDVLLKQTEGSQSIPCPNETRESFKTDQTEEKLDKVLQKMDEFNFQGVKDRQDTADRKMEEFHSRVVKDLQDKDRKMEDFHSRVVKDLQDNVDRLCTEIKTLKDAMIDIQMQKLPAD